MKCFITAFRPYDFKTDEGKQLSGGSLYLTFDDGTNAKKNLTIEQIKEFNITEDVVSLPFKGEITVFDVSFTANGKIDVLSESQE